MLKTSDGKTHLLPDQYKVEIYGSSEAFNSVKYIETAEIDLSTYKAGDEVKLKLQLPDTVKSSKGINEIEIELYEDYFESDKVEEVE